MMMHNSWSVTVSVGCASASASFICAIILTKYFVEKNQKKL